MKMTRNRLRDSAHSPYTDTQTSTQLQLLRGTGTWEVVAIPKQTNNNATERQRTLSESHNQTHGAREPMHVRVSQLPRA